MSATTLKATRVDFLRHGEVQGGACFRGRTDDPLTEQGWRQMFQQCGGQQWEVVISSPLRRCASFAAAWGQAQHIEIESESAWREIDFGDWEGLTAEQIDTHALQGFYADPVAFTPPNAECYSAFADRVRLAWDALNSRHAGKTVLVVTHGGVIRALFSQLLQMPPRNSFQIEVPYACMTRFSCFDDAVGRFVQLNFHKPL